MSWIMDIRQKAGSKMHMPNARISLREKQSDINNNVLRVFRLIQEDKSFIGDLSLDVSDTCLDENRPLYTTRDIIVAIIGVVIGTVIGFLLGYYLKTCS